MDDSDETPSCGEQGPSSDLLDSQKDGVSALDESVRRREGARRRHSKVSLDSDEITPRRSKRLRPDLGNSRVDAENWHLSGNENSSIPGKGTGRPTKNGKTSSPSSSPVILEAQMENPVSSSSKGHARQPLKETAVAGMKSQNRLNELRKGHSIAATQVDVRTIYPTPQTNGPRSTSFIELPPLQEVSLKKQHPATSPVVLPPLREIYGGLLAEHDRASPLARGPSFTASGEHAVHLSAAPIEAGQLPPPNGLPAGSWLPLPPDSQSCSTFQPYSFATPDLIAPRSAPPYYRRLSPEQVEHFPAIQRPPVGQGSSYTAADARAPDASTPSAQHFTRQAPAADTSFPHPGFELSSGHPDSQILRRGSNDSQHPRKQYQDSSSTVAPPLRGLGITFGPAHLESQESLDAHQSQQTRNAAETPWPSTSPDDRSQQAYLATPQELLSGDAWHIRASQLEHLSSAEVTSASTPLLSSHHFEHFHRPVWQSTGPVGWYNDAGTTLSRTASLTSPHKPLYVGMPTSAQGRIPSHLDNPFSGCSGSRASAQHGYQLTSLPANGTAHGFADLQRSLSHWRYILMDPTTSDDLKDLAAQNCPALDRRLQACLTQLAAEAHPLPAGPARLSPSSSNQVEAFQPREMSADNLSQSTETTGLRSSEKPLKATNATQDTPWVSSTPFTDLDYRLMAAVGTSTMVPLYPPTGRRLPETPSRHLEDLHEKGLYDGHRFTSARRTILESAHPSVASPTKHPQFRLPSLDDSCEVKSSGSTRPESLLAELQPGTSSQTFVDGSLQRPSPAPPGRGAQSKSPETPVTSTALHLAQTEDSTPSETTAADAAGRLAAKRVSGSKRRGVVDQVVAREAVGLYKQGDLITPMDYLKNDFQTTLAVQYQGQTFQDVTFGWPATACQQQRRLVHVTGSIDRISATVKITITPVNAEDYAEQYSNGQERPFSKGAVISLLFAEHISNDRPQSPSSVYWVTFQDVLKAVEATLDLGSRNLHMNNCLDVLPRLRKRLDTLSWIDLKKNGPQPQAGLLKRLSEYDDPKPANGARTIKILPWDALEQAINICLERFVPRSIAEEFRNRAAQASLWLFKERSD